MKISGVLLTAALALAPAAGRADVAGTSPAAPSGVHGLAGTEQFVLPSADAHLYSISVARPEEPAPAAGYPVIYVLDPASAFATLVETSRNQSFFFGPVVIVGVGHASGAAGGADGGERVRDMTPRTDRSTLPKDNLGTPWGAMGGADAFLQFILDQVKPAIETRLPIDRSRQALFGHSLGGLFALHTLFTRPEAFQVYVAGSPSIWWGGKSIVAEAKAFKTRPPTRTRQRLLITVGGYESEVRPEEDAALARTTPAADLAAMKRRYREHVAQIAPVENCRELFNLLAEPRTAALEVHYAEFAHETHNSVIPAYLSRGVSFMLAP